MVVRHFFLKQGRVSLPIFYFACASSTPRCTWVLSPLVDALCPAWGSFEREGYHFFFDMLDLHSGFLVVCVAGWSLFWGMEEGAVSCPVAVWQEALTRGRGLPPTIACPGDDKLGRSPTSGLECPTRLSCHIVGDDHLPGDLRETPNIGSIAMVG